MHSQFGAILGLLLAVSPAIAGESEKTPPAGSDFTVTPLVADQSGKAPIVDPNLVNPWGLSQAPGGAVWVSDNGTNLSTLYNRGNGQIQPLVVNIPMGAPTGTVYAPSNLGFNVTENGKSGAATFLFDTETGAIEGWSSSVDETNAIVAVNNSAQGASYKGLAIDDAAGLLFAADFTLNKVEVYNSSFQLVNSFTDPNLPKRYAPFNVVDVNGTLYVSFAERSKKGGIDEVDGPHLGYVDMFDTNGNLLKQLIAQGPLNAPWGMAIAPSGFGQFANDLLVGNFGDGTIHAFDPGTGNMLGTLNRKGKKALKIDGLWALDSGPGNNQVNFAAGPNDESHGLFGIISPSN